MQALQAIVARDPQVASLARQLVEIALVNRSFVPMLRKATATEIAANRTVEKAKEALRLQHERVATAKHALRVMIVTAQRVHTKSQKANTTVAQLTKQKEDLVRQVSGVDQQLKQQQELQNVDQEMGELCERKRGEAVELEHAHARAQMRLREVLRDAAQVRRAIHEEVMKPAHTDKSVEEKLREEEERTREQKVLATAELQKQGDAARLAQQQAETSCALQKQAAEHSDDAALQRAILNISSAKDNVNMLSRQVYAIKHNATSLSYADASFRIDMQRQQRDIAEATEAVLDAKATLQTAAHILREKGEAKRALEAQRVLYHTDVMARKAQVLEAELKYHLRRLTSL